MIEKSSGHLTGIEALSTSDGGMVFLTQDRRINMKVCEFVRLTLTNFDGTLIEIVIMDYYGHRFELEEILQEAHKRGFKVPLTKDVDLFISQYPEWTMEEIVFPCSEESHKGWVIVRRHIKGERKRSLGEITTTTFGDQGTYPFGVGKFVFRVS